MLFTGPFRRPALLITLAVAVATVPSAAQSDLTSTIARVEQLASTEFAKDPRGSLTIGLVSRDRLAWSKSYGEADVEQHIAATADSVYRIGSITKQFTGLMLLQLVERGTVRLTDPVEKYLPEINRIAGREPGWPAVTLIQLATMTSGIAREPQDLETFLSGPVSTWEQTTIKALERTRFAHEPGTRYLYSNIGYAILGAALSRAARKPFTDYVRDEILIPLGMTRSAFELNPGIAAAIAKGYTIRDGVLDGSAPAREHEGRGYKVPNGTLYTTVGISRSSLHSSLATVRRRCCLSRAATTTTRACCRRPARSIRDTASVFRPHGAAPWLRLATADPSPATMPPRTSIASRRRA